MRNLPHLCLTERVNRISWADSDVPLGTIVRHCLHRCNIKSHPHHHPLPPAEQLCLPPSRRAPSLWFLESSVLPEKGEREGREWKPCCQWGTAEGRRPTREQGRFERRVSTQRKIFHEANNLKLQDSLVRTLLSPST